MLKKIISGGQTGADQAALDVAIKLGIPYGGWIPKGRLTENGSLPDKYKLQEMPTNSYPKRTEKNILDSDGTVIISHGKLTGGSALTRKLAKQHKRPWIHIDPNKTQMFLAVSELYDWTISNNIEILNIAGSRASKDPKIYKDTFYIIEGAYLLSLIKAGPGSSLSEYKVEDSLDKLPLPPKTINEAVGRLITDMKLKDKTTIANMTEEELILLHANLGVFIRNTFGLWEDNKELLESCCSIIQTDDLSADNASDIIIEELWKKLRETHKLRIVK